MARRESARSVRRGSFLLGWRSPFDQVLATQRQYSVPEAVMDLAKPHWQAMSRATPQATLPAESRTMVKLLVPQRAKPSVLELQARPRDWLLLQAPEIPLARVRARQCLPGPGPFAFFPEIPDDQKCNRAVRCGDCPTSARYRRRCSRRGLVGYGNRRSRLLRKRARPFRTFPIAAADKCPSPLRRIQD
jgi:hypothetical protein